MRINTNVSALNAANNLSRTQDAVASSMAKLSSGFRINKASDDAAGLGIANKLSADTRALSQAARNAEQGNSLLSVAEGSASTIQKMLERMKELATQAGSDTVDTAARGRIDTEFRALRDEITRTVATTKFQGANLLDGTYGSAPDTGNFLIGATDGQYDTTTPTATANVLNVQLGNLSVTAANAGPDTGLNLGDGEVGVTNLDLTTGAGARDATTQIDAALVTVNAALGGIGAAQNRISYAQDNLKTTIANFSAAESVIRDVDMAEEMTKFSKNNILAQAGTAMLAQANQSGQSVLKLLQ